MDKKVLTNSRSFPRIISLAEPEINLQSLKSTPDSLKERLTAFERKRSSGAAD